MITRCWWMAMAAGFVMIPAAQASADEPNIVFADFERDDYGAWKATGAAFGAGPAKGTLPQQMPVSGFQGERLVNSFLGGDGATGTLTSPEFKIERRSIAFLIGGGGHEGKTCVNLLVEGKVVRTMAGPNTQPGGSEALEPGGWNVADLAGQTARLEIVDEATGGWGHINVDQIVFTDREINGSITRPSRELVAQRRYLHFPVKNRAAKRRVSVSAGGQVVRELTIELADDAPDWWAPLDISAWRDQTLVVQVDKLPDNSQALANVSQSDALNDADDLYREPLRPQLHFSPRRGWTNDPNGMVYADGEYHLYFQHNPFGVQWDNMHWGHAVSRDLAHWGELPIALYPPRFGDMAFSGSAVVDKDNTSGWKQGGNDLLVAAFTSTGRGECILYSHDRGRTWKEFEGNPVVKHAGRDPRLLWHAPSRQWVMALYDEYEKKQWIAFYTSPNLRDWTFQSRIEPFYECPDMFDLPLDGDDSNRKWVLTAANSDYQVGTFDGKAFAAETPKLTGSLGRAFYAAQTFTLDPQGRVIQIGWLRAESPGMPFNQCMSLPLELRLKSTADGPRLMWRPVDELAALNDKSHDVAAMSLMPGHPNPLANVRGEILRLDAEFTQSAEAVVTFDVRGVPITYSAAKQKLTVGTLTVSAPLTEGKQTLTIFADRTVFEVFASSGLAYVPVPVIPKAADLSLSVSVAGGDVQFSKLQVRELGSIWRP